MANRDIVTRTGAGVALTAANHDQNLNSLAGTVDQQTGTTYTVVYTDQGKTIELNNATMTCTLDAIATIAAAIDTDHWQVTLKNINAAAATIARSSTDTFDGATSLTLKQYEAVTLQIDGAGTAWNIKNEKTRTFDNIDVNGGAIDGTPIGGASAEAITGTTITGTTITGTTITGTTITASTGFVGTGDFLKTKSGAGSLTNGTMQVFVSSAYAYTAVGMALSSKAHGLSGAPNELSAFAICIDNTVDTWATVGNVYSLVLGQGNLVNVGVIVTSDGTNISGRVGNGGIGVIQPTSGAGALLNPAATRDWDIYIVAKYYA